MCPWVGPHAPSFGRQLWGLPSRVEYLSPQGVLLPLVYGTTASPLWLELRGHSAWQATPSWTVYRLACHRLLSWLRVTFGMVPDAAWSGSDQWPWSTAPATGPVGRLGRPSVSDRWGVGSFLSLGRPTCVRCPGPLGSCSPVCPRGLLCCVCGVLGHLAPVHRCARSVCCVACAVSWATWLPFTGAPAWCVVLRVRCPGPPGSCSPVRPLGVLCCVCGVLGHLAEIISFLLLPAVQKKAQNGINGKKDTFFRLIFCFQKTEPVKSYFFAWSRLGALGVILTMQLEPPK